MKNEWTSLVINAHGNCQGNSLGLDYFYYFLSYKDVTIAIQKVLSYPNFQQETFFEWWLDPKNKEFGFSRSQFWKVENISKDF